MSPVQTDSGEYEELMSQLSSAFWRGEFATAMFAVRRYIAQKNEKAQSEDEPHRVDDLPEHEQPQQANWLVSRRGIYSLLIRRYVYFFLFEAGDQLEWPPTEGDAGDELSAFDKLADRRFEDYPPEAQLVLENISVDVAEFQRWAPTQVQFRPTLEPRIVEPAVPESPVIDVPETQHAIDTAPEDWYNQVCDYLNGPYYEEHKNDRPHPNRDTALKAIREVKAFMGYPITTEIWRGDIWKKGPAAWHKAGPRTSK